jgi:hypothetical protein
MRRDCVELTRAISRFCRMNRLFTEAGMLVSVLLEKKLRLRYRVLKTYRWGKIECFGHIQASMDSVGTGGSLSRAIDAQSQFRTSESVNVKLAISEVYLRFIICSCCKML